LAQLGCDDDDAASASLNEQQRTGKLFLGYLRAYSRAIRWLYDPKNKDQAINLLVKYSKQDRKDSADTYDYFVTKLRAFSADGRISDTSYKRMTGALVEWGDLKQPQRLYESNDYPLQRRLSD
jgi:ABC-type nitrate/sulfonate/bicarbonate transport system substrate-binding protein